MNEQRKDERKALEAFGTLSSQGPINQRQWGLGKGRSGVVNLLPTAAFKISTLSQQNNLNPRTKNRACQEWSECNCINGRQKPRHIPSVPTLGGVVFMRILRQCLGQCTHYCTMKVLLV